MDLSPEHTIDAVMSARNGVILDAIMKCESVFERHERAVVSISGGQTPIASSTCASASEG